MSMAEHYLPSRNPVLAKLHAEHAARRARIEAGANQPKPIAAPSSYVLVRRRVEPTTLEPATAHILAYYAHLANVSLREARAAGRAVHRGGVVLVVPSIVEIQEAVSTYYEVRRVDLLSDRRTADIVRPRQIAMYLVQRIIGCGYFEIGRRFGNRDHTTVLHGCRKIGAALESGDESIASAIAEITRMLGVAL